MAKAELDAQAREIASREAALRAETASLADERAEVENAKAFLEQAPASYTLNSNGNGGGGVGEAAVGSSDEQSRRAAAWQQKRTQEMMALKRKNQTLEAGAEKLKQELATAHAEVKALEGKLEAEAAAAKARNSSTWRLRQENERLVKAEALRQQQQSGGGEGSSGAQVAVGPGPESSSSVISAAEAKALHDKVRRPETEREGSHGRELLLSCPVLHTLSLLFTALIVSPLPLRLPLATCTNCFVLQRLYCTVACVHYM